MGDGESSSTPPAASYPLSILVMLLAAVIGWGLNLIPSVTTPGLALDEHVSFWIVDDGPGGTLRQRSLEYSATPPLSFQLQRLSLALFGQQAWALRLPSLVCLLAGGVFVFLAGRLAGHPHAGAIGALLILWDPNLTEIGRQARPYGLTVALAAASLYVGLRWTKRPVSWFWALAWCLVQVGLIWTHYVNLVTTVATFAVLFSPWGLRFPARQKVLFALTTATGIGLLSLPLAGGFVRLWVERQILEFLPKPPGPVSYFGLLVLILFPVGVIGMIFKTKHRKPRSLSSTPFTTATPSSTTWAILALGPAVQVLFLLLSHTFSATLGHPRYSLAALPATWLLVGLMLTVAMPVRGAIVGLICGLSIAWVEAGRPPWRSPTLQSPSTADWREIGRTIERQGKPGEPIFVYGGLIEAGAVPMFGDDPLFLSYVACRAGRFFIPSDHPRLALPMLAQQLEGSFPFYETAVSSAARSELSIWVATATDTDLGQQTGAAFEQALQRARWRPNEPLTCPTARLVRFDPADAVMDKFGAVSSRLEWGRFVVLDKTRHAIVWRRYNSCAMPIAVSACTYGALVTGQSS